MKRLKWPPQEQPQAPINFLKAIHILFTQSMNVFRDKVLEECGWSTPTFYRKMRGTDISNAERDKMLQIALELVKQHYDFCTKLAAERERGMPSLSTLLEAILRGNGKA